MALKVKYEDVKQIPAGDERLYVERDGAWMLDVENDGTRARLDEFRTHNVALRKELEELRTKFDGINPEEVRGLAEEKRKLEEEKQLKAGEVDKVVEGRVKGLKADWDRQVTALTGERDSLNSRLTAIQIDQGVITAATKRGLRSTAIPDITARARTVFKLVSGVPRAFEADGTSVRYGRDGVTPMTLEEWVDAQTSDAPHLFESNAGGGAASNGGGAAAGSNRSVKNPFRRETWNVTEQMAMQRTDPQLAARLKAAAE
jgi:hypothetical protein